MASIRSCSRISPFTAKPFRTFSGWAGLAAILAISLVPSAARPDPDICGYPAHEHVAINRGGHKMAEFSVTLAATITERGRGLMNCPQLEPGTGMLFLYETIGPRVFWMKDTPLELGIIFVAADGKITAIEKGSPGSLTRISSPGPVRYVLEINYDESHSLQVGDHVQRIAPDALRPPTTAKGRP